MKLSISQLQAEIIKLKKEKNAVIMAHSYQSPEILEVCDYSGDSFKLSTLAKELESDLIYLCGVRFMGETAKLLSPQKTVIMPVLDATCPMAEQISPERVTEFKKQNPQFKVVAYVNTTAALKAVCDVCVTSSSALKIVSSLKEKDILFIPDKNLGGYIKQMLPEKNILLWEGYCPVHNAVTEQEAVAAKQKHPQAKLLMHPELPSAVLKHADLIGSTADILNYANQTDEECIIGTENSIADFLKLNNPHQKFHLLSKNLICPDMRMTTLMDLYNALLGKGGEEIILDPEIAKKAVLPINEMISLG